MLVDIDQDGLDATRQALGGGDRIAIAKADVSNESDVARYVEATVGALGRIDVFFNNAGIEGKVAPLEEQDISMFDKVIAINVRGAYLGLKHVLPHMYKARSEEHTSELQPLMRISYAVFCLKQKKN